MIKSKLEGLDILNVELLAIRNPEIRKKAVMAVGKQVRKNSIERAKNQRNVDGSKFKKHAKGRKRKLLTRIARRSKVHSVNELGGELGWRNPTEEKIAAKQHFGFRQTVTAASLRADERTTDSEKNRFKDATRRQAKALIAEGYQVKRKDGKGFAKPTIRFITQTMNIGRAGVILRALRGGAKKEWETILPKRQFLGIEINEVPELQKIISDVVKQTRSLKNA